MVEHVECCIGIDEHDADVENFAKLLKVFNNETNSKTQVGGKSTWQSITAEKNPSAAFSKFRMKSDVPVLPQTILPLFRFDKRMML